MATNLKGKNIQQLRQIARKLKINPAGKNAADLIREIEKKEKGNAGKGTAADPKAKGSRKTAPPARRGRKPVEEEEDEDEDEEGDEDEGDEEEAPKVKSKPKGKKGNPLGAVVTLLTEALSIVKGSIKSGAADEDEEEEGEDDEEEEEDEKPKRGGRKPSKSSKDDDDEEDEEEEEDEEDEDGDEDEESGKDEFTPEALAAMDVKALVKVAKKLNASGIGGKTKLNTEETNARKLRAAITKFLEQFADEETDDEEDEEDDEEEKPKKKGRGRKASKDEDDDEDEEEEDDEEAERPDWIRVGAKVVVNFEDEDPQSGVISDIDDDEQSCSVDLDDGGSADASWDSMEPAKKRAKKR